MADIQADRSLRVLSCVLCQQRKVRCDRTFPCANCIKSKTQCVPAHLIPRPRKRRFPERELLDRLRQYEGLLRQHEIRFDPLHQEQSKSKDSQHVDSESKRQERPLSVQPKVSEEPHEPRDIWNAMIQRSPEPDDDGTPVTEMTEAVVKKTWDQVFDNSDPLFGVQHTHVDLPSLHPEPSQIFRLWQIYLEHVDPLFKITHTPTLQGRIIEAIANLSDAKPALVALMFSIYCISICSLTETECNTLFRSSKDELLARYQNHCRQALVSAGFLRSDDRDCLTALFLFTVSLRPSLDPRTVSSMLAIAIRTAQRIGIQSESGCAKFPPMEAEMRRRLWWTLVLFDARIAEMADHRTSMLTPLWDCKIPIGVNDLDLRPEMKHVPDVQGPLTEALFIVLRSELGDFLRNSSFHLDFIAPSLKALAKNSQGPSGPEANDLDKLEKWVEERFLRFCNPDNPLHFITIWMTRGTIAKYRLFDYYSRFMAGQQTEADRDTAMSYALTMLDCDTKIGESAPAQRYFWLMRFFFPFPAYIYLLQNLRRRPRSQHVTQSWTSMSENFEARGKSLRAMSPRLLFQGMTSGTMTTFVFEAWEACAMAMRQSGQTAVEPKIVSIMREWRPRNTSRPEHSRPPSDTTANTHSANWSAPVDLGYPLPAMGGDSLSTLSDMWMPFEVPMQIPSDDSFGQADWSMMNWGP
ncbi:hypothetical protein BJX70DRAFT_406017 [Aspergillus crustosus]